MTGGKSFGKIGIDQIVGDNNIRLERYDFFGIGNGKTSCNGNFFNGFRIAADRTSADKILFTSKITNQFRQCRRKRHDPPLSGKQNRRTTQNKQEDMPSDHILIIPLFYLSVIRIKNPHIFRFFSVYPPDIESSFDIRCR